MQNILKEKTKLAKKIVRNPVALTFLGVLLALLTLFTLYNFYYSEKIFPGISIAGIKVGGLKIEDATKRLQREVVPQTEVILNSSSDSFKIPTQEIGTIYNFEKSAENAYNIDRTGNILFDFASRIETLYKPRNLGLRIRLNEDALSKQIGVVDATISVEPIEPSVRVVEKEVVVDKGTIGTTLDKKLLRSQIGEALAFLKTENIALPTKVVDPRLSDEDAKNLKEKAEKIYQKSISLKFEFQNFAISGNDLLSFLGVKGGINDEAISRKIEIFALQINRDPQDSRFIFENGKAKEFAPSKDGVEVDSQKLKSEISNTITTLEEGNENQIALDVPVIKTEAKIKTEEVNNLGIKELIGRGTSRFTGSIPSRVHNVVLASSRLNGTIIPPGETLSFNNAVGDVSALTGYQQAYVIKDGKTVLGDGGGLCQVSTTLFRAALNTGLPITERRAHSYRVGYYEQDGGPGLDATVYSPTTDFKFKNDTPGHILIQTIADPKNYSLIFEIYGTSDGRSATVTKPVVSQVVRPADDLYQDDPTLPAGVIKQVEHRANGAKVSFSYSVTRDGQNIYEKNFVSNYRPWQAVYLRGAGPVQ